MSDLDEDFDDEDSEDADDGEQEEEENEDSGLSDRNNAAGAHAGLPPALRDLPAWNESNTSVHLVAELMVEWFLLERRRPSAS